jgi:hypothetical protein
MCEGSVDDDRLVYRRRQRPYASPEAATLAKARPDGSGTVVNVEL